MELGRGLGRLLAQGEHGGGELVRRRLVAQPLAVRDALHVEHAHTSQPRLPGVGAGVGLGPARGGGGGRGSACQEPKPAATRSGEMIASVEPTAMSVGVCGVQSSSQTPARSQGRWRAMTMEVHSSFLNRKSSKERCGVSTRVYTNSRVVRAWWMLHAIGSMYTTPPYRRRPG